MRPTLALVVVAVSGLLLAVVDVDAEVFGRCELAAALKAQGIAGRDIATWVCIAERLSSIDTETVTDASEDPDGTSYHGLFLISDRWWCDNDGSGGRGCGVSCEQMRATLASNIECAKKVFAETKRTRKDGFLAWQAYEDCRRPAGYVRGCAGVEDPPAEEEADVDLAPFLRSGAPGAAGAAGKSKAKPPRS